MVTDISRPAVCYFLESWFDSSEIHTRAALNDGIKSMRNTIEGLDIVVCDGNRGLESIAEHSSCLVLGIQRVVVGKVTTWRSSSQCST